MTFNPWFLKPKMIKSGVVLIAFSLFQCIAQELTADSSCGNHPGSGRSLRLSVNSRRNQTGEWVDTFTARTEASNSSDSMGMDVTHNFIECDGKRIIYIQGVLKATSVKNHDGLTFHSRCGTNAEILDKGRSAQKRNNDDASNSAVFTNRPLRNNELFQVSLDKKGSKFSYSLGIGILTSTPSTVVIPSYIHHSSDAWMYHNNAIYSGIRETRSNYGRNVNTLQVGDRLGVMRKESGDIHFFVNGVDQGSAIPNIASPVYGVVDLWYNAQKVTIVEA